MRLVGRQLISLAVALAIVLLARCDHPAREEPPAATPASPSSQPASPVPRSVRVLLADRLRKCEIVVSGVFDLRDADRGTLLIQKVSTPRLTVEFKEGVIGLPDLHQSFEVQAIDIVTAEGVPLAVALAEGAWRRYSGMLTVYQSSDRTGAILNTLDIEDYLVSVVSSELPNWFYSEAVRAQAIAARTYTWYQKGIAPPGRRWDVLATEGSQVYVGLNRGEGWRRAGAAVRSTCGLVCTWAAPEGERIFCTYYSSTCGGSTQAAAPVKNESLIPPLAGKVKCDYCRHSAWYYWGPCSISKKVITERLRQRYTKFQQFGQIEQIKVIEETPDGRPVRFDLRDARGEGIDLEAENFRLAVDPSGRVLRSTFFKIAVKGNDFIFYEGRGFGHGMGLCQYGADGLARGGASARYILAYYYPESHVIHAY